MLIHDSSHDANKFWFLCDSHNTEKVIYFLLLERKRRRPAFEDDTEAIVRVRSESSDPPRKRIDTCKVNGTATYQFGQISEGSPLTPRRQQFKYVRLLCTLVSKTEWVCVMNLDNQWSRKMFVLVCISLSPHSSCYTHINLHSYDFSHLSTLANNIVFIMSVCVCVIFYSYLICRKVCYKNK